MWAASVSGPGSGATDPAAILCILYRAYMVDAIRERTLGRATFLTPPRWEEAGRSESGRSPAVGRHEPPICTAHSERF